MVDHTWDITAPRRKETAAMLQKLRAHKVHADEGEVSDIPFRKNDLKQHLTTMDRPLDPADGPGKADAELADELSPLENS